MAMVFSTVEFARPLVFKTISELLGEVPMIGCSSLALISNKGIHKTGVLILLANVPKDIPFRSACIKNISAREAAVAGQELGEKLLAGFTGFRRDLSIILSDGLMHDGSGFLSGLQEKLGKSFPLIGGSSSDNLTFKKTYQYFNGELLDNAACGILWGGRLNFGLGIKHGWKALGKPRYVTSSSGNTVYEIDNQPAVEFYKEYLAYDLGKIVKELKRLSVLYPIGIYLSGEEEYLLRNIHSLEDSGAITFQGNVPQGSLVRLMIGTEDSCLAACRQAIEEVKRSLFGHRPNFLLVFDSISRYVLLGRKINRELGIIQEEFGKETPIVGIYTYGEQAPLKAMSYQGRAYFHNQSIAILGVSA
jgi:hypothetical protein